MTYETHRSTLRKVHHPFWVQHARFLVDLQRNMHSTLHLNPYTRHDMIEKVYSLIISQATQTYPLEEDQYFPATEGDTCVTSLKLSINFCLNVGVPIKPDTATTTVLKIF